MAGLTRLGRTLEKRRCEVNDVLTARAFIREHGVYLEVKVHEIERVRLWYADVSWELFQDNPERAVDMLLGHFEAKVVSVLEQERAE